MMTKPAENMPEEIEELEQRTSMVAAVLGPTITLLALIGLWEVLARWSGVPSWLLPAPSAIGEAMIDWRAELAWHSMVTLYEVLVGFALSIVVSIPLAVAVVYSPFLQNTIYPILLALQSMPKVAIAPLLVLWIGFGAMPKILVVFLVCFFPIVVATASGLSAVPPALIDLIRSLSATIVSNLHQNQISDRNSAHLCRFKNSDHFRRHWRRDRRICRIGSGAGLLDFDFDIPVADAACIWRALDAYHHEHRALLCSRVRGTSRRSVGTQELAVEDFIYA